MAQQMTKQPIEQKLAAALSNDSIGSEQLAELISESESSLLVSMQRPGFRRLVGGNRGQQNIIDRQREKVLDARRAYVDDLQSAWQSPPTGAGSHGHEYSGGQVGDVCSINGRPGRLVEGDDGSLVCTANADNAANINELDHMSLPQLQAHRRRVTDVAYKEYESWISNQWHSK